MNRFQSIFLTKISTDRFDIRFGQLLCFAAAPLFLGCALLAIRRHAMTPGEIVTGLLAAASCTMLFVIMGIVLPLGQFVRLPSVERKSKGTP